MNCQQYIIGFVVMLSRKAKHLGIEIKSRIQFGSRILPLRLHSGLKAKYAQNDIILNNIRQSTDFLLVQLVILFAISGCVQQIARPIPVCPGKQSAQDALSTLSVRAEKGVSFRGNGQCYLKYTSEKRKRVAQNFPVQVWVSPPHEIYLQGNVAVDGRAVVMGSNDDEFWLAIRPQEISSFYWGRWDDAGLINELPVSPQIALEAIGLIAQNLRDDGSVKWTLSCTGAYDVLTSRSVEGRIIKRIHIYNCDYLIRQIEYFNDQGDVLAVVKMGEYEKIADECFVPKKIEITKQTGSGSGDVIKLSFSSVRAAKFNDKVRQKIFVPPYRAGFKHIYKLENGVIEESSE